MTTTGRPTSRTPAGACLTVHRGHRWSSVTVDRITTDDATDSQAATVRSLALAAARWCAGHGRPGATFLYGVTIWYVTCPTVDLDEALAALLALEADDHAPALALAARYTA